MTDREWLEKVLGRVVSNDEIEAFSERVSIMIFDGSLDEQSARELTVKTWIK
jgi:hypothetical protein